jgi:hypothetical protein
MFGSARIDDGLLNPQAIEGPTAGLFESTALAYDAQRLGYSAAGAQNQFRARLHEYRNQFEEAGVLDDPNVVFPFPQDMGSFSILIDAIDQGVPIDQVGEGFTMAERGEAQFFYDNWDTAIAPLVEGTPTLGELLQEIREEAQRAETQFEATDTNMLGTFIGAMAGSFTEADPLNLITLPIGGFGSTLLKRMLSEAAVQSTIEGVNQFAAVPQNRELLGLPEMTLGEQFLNVGAAGFGGAAVRGIGEGAVAGVNTLRLQRLEQTNPRAAAELRRRLEFQQLMRTQRGRDTQSIAYEFDQMISGSYLMSTPALRAWGEFMPNTVAGRAARTEIDAVARYAEMDMFTDPAQRFLAEIRLRQEIAQDQQIAAVGGRPPERNLFETIVPTRADTELDQSAKTAAVERDTSVNAARQVILTERVKELDARYEDLEAQLEAAMAAERGVDEAPLSQLVDDQQVRLLEESIDAADAPPRGEMAQQLRELFPVERSVNAAYRLRQIEEAQFPNARRDAKIRAGIEADRIRRQLAEVRRERFQARQLIRESRANIREGVATRESMAQLVPQAPSLRGVVSHVDAPAANRAVLEVNEALPKTQSRMMERFRATIADATGRVDLGNGRMVDRDFTFVRTDAFGENGRNMTVDDITEELDLEQRIMDAVSVCTIG